MLLLTASTVLPVSIPVSHVPVYGNSNRSLTHFTEAKYTVLKQSGLVFNYSERTNFHHCYRCDLIATLLMMNSSGLSVMETCRRCEARGQSASGYCGRPAPVPNPQPSSSIRAITPRTSSILAYLLVLQIRRFYDDLCQRLSQLYRFLSSNISFDMSTVIIPIIITLRTYHHITLIQPLGVPENPDSQNYGSEPEQFQFPTAPCLRAKYGLDDWCPRRSLA